MNPMQCRAARALLGLSRPELSRISDVGKNTIQAFEAGQHHANRSTISKLQAAFANLSVRFTQDHDGIGVHRNFHLDEVEDREQAYERVRPEPVETMDDPSMPITPAQARAARAFLDMSQTEAAVSANVGLSLIVAFETGLRIPRSNNLEKIRVMYERRGIKFAVVNGVPAVQALSPEDIVSAEPSSNRGTVQ